MNPGNAIAVLYLWSKMPWVGIENAANRRLTGSGFSDYRKIFLAISCKCPPGKNHPQVS
ncbi:hypothetical protein [Planktothricoides raciborskii]|uniref:Transposase n=1 Tax=Planktothricoides raciborskii GIHE-MW2 TaxID=2792601 RepID=A0AAU8JMI1_9CYAN